MNRFSASYIDKQYTDNDGKKWFTFIVSSNDIDRAGDTINVQGIDLSEYERNPIVLRNHFGNVIGLSKVYLDGNILYGDVWFDEVTEVSKETKKQIEAGTLKTASIGLEVLETSVRDLTNSEIASLKRKYIKKIRSIDKSIMIEWSVVDLPANIEAELQRAMSKDLEIDKELLKTYIKDFKMTETKTLEVDLETKAGAKISKENRSRLQSAIDNIAKVLENTDTEQAQTEQETDNKEYVSLQDFEQLASDVKALQDQLSNYTLVKNYSQILKEQQNG